MKTLPQFLDALAAEHGEREAVAYAPTDTVTQRRSWIDLRDESRRAARKLLSIGVQKGTRVGLLCSNHIDWLPLAFGVLRTGAVLVPFSTLWKRDEIAYGLNHGDVEVLITLPGFRKHDYLASVCEIAPSAATAGPGHIRDLGAPTLRRVIVLADKTNVGETWDSIPDDVDDAFLDAMAATVTPVDLATIFFTSGTTSQAKAVVHNQGALALSATRLAPCFGITPDDVWWGHMPLFWSGGFVLGALASLAGGARLVLHETVTPDAALRILEEERCTIMAGWHQGGPLLEHPDFDASKIHLRKGTYHSLAPQLMGADHRTIGVYGMSETATCVTACNASDPEEIRTSSFGRPLAGMRVKIIDPDTLEEVPNGETGEILVKGPTLMEGYYKVDRNETLDTDGYLQTGDLGYFDAAGDLHFASRLKDVIKTAGVNVAAVEVEDTLAAHESVKAAHVVGVSDPVRGENIAAWIVLSEGARADEETLRAFCKEKLAAYKVPRHYLFIAEDEVARTGTGKVAKAELRKRAEERLS